MGAVGTGMIDERLIQEPADDSVGFLLAGLVVVLVVFVPWVIGVSKIWRAGRVWLGLS
jgi:hypothetical protein